MTKQTAILKSCALSFRHAIEHREPAVGFASRLAAVNGRSLGDFLYDMRLSRRELSNGAEATINDLAEIGGADAYAVRRYSARRSGPKSSNLVGDEVLGGRAVNRTTFRFCPHCVQEDLDQFRGPLTGRPWLRLQWTINSFRSCDRHSVLTVSTKPQGTRFEHFDFARVISTYFEDLSRLIRESTPVEASAFQKWILSRLDGHRDPEGWLDRLPLYVGVEFCEGLGISALHSSREKVSELDNRQLLEAANEGYLIASQGRDGVLNHLDQLNQGEQRTLGVWGPRDTFGHVFALLQRTVKDPAYKPVRDLVRSYVVANLPVRQGTILLGVPVLTPTITTIRSTARATGIHDATARKLFLRQGIGLPGLDAGLTNHRVTARSTEIGEVFQKLKGSIFSSQLKEDLKIPRTHLTALMEIGALSSLRLEGGNPSTKHRFAKSDIDAMMTRLLSGSVEVALPSSRQLSIWDARAVACTSLTNLLSMVFDGKVRWKGRLSGRWDYSAALVDVDEVIALVRTEPKRQGLTAREAAHFIPGLKAEAIPRLIELNALRTEEEFSPEARRLVEVVPTSSAAEFVGRFITLGEFCRRHGLNAKRGEALLRRANVPTAFEPKVVHAWIYERTMVESSVTTSSEVHR